MDPKMKGKRWKSRINSDTDDAFDIHIKVVCGQRIDVCRYRIPSVIKAIGLVRFENIRECLPELTKIDRKSTKRHCLVEVRKGDADEVGAYKALCSRLKKQRRGLVFDLKRQAGVKLYLLPPKQKKIKEKEISDVWGELPRMQKYIWGYMLFYGVRA